MRSHRTPYPGAPDDAWDLFSRPDRSDARFRALFEQATVGICTFDESLRVQEVNPAFERILGLDRGRLLGYDLSLLQDQNVLAMLRQSLKGVSSSYEGPYRSTLSSRLSWVSLHVNPMRAVNGALDGGFAILQNHSEHPHGGEAQTRLAAIVESTEDAILSLDLDGVITSWNHAAERIFGFRAAEAIGRSIRLIVPDELWADALGNLERVRDGEHVFQDDTTRVRKDGTQLCVSLTVSAMRAPDGTLCGFSSILRDVTAQRGLEAQLLQAQKMEAMGRLAGGVAHDFNNILTAILSNCELAMAAVGEDSSARDDLAEIKLAAKRAAALTRQLLAFSRRQLLRLELLDLNSVITDAEKMLRRVIGEDVEFVTDLDAGIGFIRADRGHLEQILMNLVLNSRDAMPHGGRLTVRTADRIVEDRADRQPGVAPGRYVSLEVTDTGTGMDAATQARVFEPFFTTKEKGHGTGLGLSTVYGIVKQLGGFVRVRSASGEGCSFTLLFPVVSTEGRARDSSSSVAATPTVGNEVILLVEDEPAVRISAARTLRKRGYHVIEAESAEQAMALCVGAPQMPVHLILSDIVMPGANGPTLVEWLQHRHAEVHALFMSGYADDPTGRLAAMGSRTRILQKPFSAAELSAAVRQALDAEP